MNRIGLIGVLGLATACMPGSVKQRYLEPNAGGPTDAGVSNPGNLPPIQPPEASIVNAVYDECPDYPHDLRIPILVNDAQNMVERQPTITSFMVPFDLREAVFSLNSLIVRDENGERLPAQFEALSRYDGHVESCAHPLRYAYAFVRAVPPPGETIRWFVENEMDNVGEPTTLQLDEQADRWSIDTGVARFTVRRDQFTGLAMIELPDGQGGYTVLSEAGPQGTFILEHEGTKTTAGGTAWQLALERSGPQLVTIVARGRYGQGGAEDLGYTIRMHFYASSDTVRVEHTYYYGEVENSGINGLTNRTLIDRAFMRLPLVGAASTVLVRGLDTVHTLDPSNDIVVQQEKRTPNASAVRFAIREGSTQIESGTWAERPFLGVQVGENFAMATVGRMAEREPQGLRWNPQSQALEVDFTSTPMQIGGARGIWSVAALKFGRGAASNDLADPLQLHAERPLIATPAPDYLNQTKTIGPYVAEPDATTRPLLDKLAIIHQQTRDYLRTYRVTGLQIWPDMPRSSCVTDVTCDSVIDQLYEGGDNNYWNWSKPGVDEFFRTGNNDFIYDFSLGEATTYVETLAVRTYHDRIADSSLMGLAVCYGNSRGFGGDYQEGLNNRRDRCAADYSYDKTLKLAYLATGDRRFVDFFEEGGRSVTNVFETPTDMALPFTELSLSRLSEQRLELLADGAEFARDRETGAFLIGKLREYTDFMLGRTLIDGHACSTHGSGHNNVRNMGVCRSHQAWMTPMGVEWSIRTSRFLSHADLADWVIRHGEISARNHTVVDPEGRPDIAQQNSTDGWRTVYVCDTNSLGLIEGSCRKQMDGENSNYFYQNGLMAYLNVFGLVLGANPQDPHGICRWLPEAYNQHLGSMSRNATNSDIWGKVSGQAFNMAAETMGAISLCP